MTERLPPDATGIAQAAAILRDGGLVAFPTDTVYGVAVAASRRDRMDALFALKRRPVDRRIPMLVSGLDEIPTGWVVDERARALASRFWPGALTLVLAPSESGGESQAFRAPDHPVALALIREAGPLLTTSANISDEPETLDADEVLVAFATQNVELDAVVDGGPVPGGVASTVVDLTQPEARILREGPVTADMLADVVSLSP
ncbi:MAG TPA: L-threonylcarbamoyladenylate synthase [candidate division Zixibacteria bacterium]|nr:L-threonylcarbamoyladenylate synthase [candidate division Zixibacteria bacterium]